MTTRQAGDRRIADGGASTMRRHFGAIAHRYGHLRTLDDAPVQHIGRRLEGVAPIAAADVGCGDGRYSLALFERLPGLHLTCLDPVPEMIERAAASLRSAGIEDFRCLCATAEDFELPSGSLDVVTTFNAIHHFDLDAFLRSARDALRPGGRLFVYTRLPDQNARTIWGRYFPRFAERETRLYALDRLHAAVDSCLGLRFETATRFRYPRVASLARLCEQARHRHYSTFALYDPEEFETSLRTFEQRIRADFPDAGRVTWQDENVLLEVRRLPA